MKNDNKITNNLSFYIERLQALELIENGNRVNLSHIEGDISNFANISGEYIKLIKGNHKTASLKTALLIYEYIKNQFEDIEIQFTDIFKIENNYFKKNV